MVPLDCAYVRYVHAPGVESSIRIMDFNNTHEALALDMKPISTLCCSVAMAISTMNTWPSELGSSSSAIDQHVVSEAGSCPSKPRAIRHLEMGSDRGEGAWGQMILAFACLHNYYSNKDSLLRRFAQRGLPNAFHTYNVLMALVLYALLR